MHRLLLMTLALLLSTAPLTTPVAARPGADAHPGPFYDSPVALPQTHGALMRKRRYVGPLKVRGAINKKVLYSQVGVDGEMRATSGFVSVPRTRPPVGGFPIVTWGHGTTGAADRCAPSVEASRPLRVNPANDLIQDWVDRGWAVVRTDYEGLGTRGLHPYLVGSIGFDQSISVIALRDSRAADANSRAETSSVPWSRRLMTFSDRPIAAVMENSLPGRRRS